MGRAHAADDHRGVVRRASLLVQVVVTAVAGQAATAVAATGFGDPFDALDAGRWSIGDHRLDLREPGAGTRVGRVEVAGA